MSDHQIQNPTKFEADIVSAYRARANPNRMHDAAFARFCAGGMPGRRDEGWRWSDIGGVLRNEDGAINAPALNTVAPSVFSGLNPIEFRIINGEIMMPPQSEMENAGGVAWTILDNLGTIPELDANPVVSLNVAMTDKALGVEVRAPKAESGAAMAQPRPILIRHINEAAGSCFVQCMLRVGEGASATFIETFEGAGAVLGSCLNQIVMHKNSNAQRYVVNQQGREGVTHAVCGVRVEKDCSYTQTSLSTGSKLSRHETIVHYHGENARAQLDSVAILSDSAHADFTTNVLHKKPGCTTRQLHRSVGADKASSVFQGKFEVERVAQKTDSQMTANALLLSERAQANHKPELEIYADDVECAHGSTSGALDQDQLFYLRQRGLSEREARQLLIKAFASNVIERVSDDSIRDVLSGRIDQWLENV